MGRRAIQSQFNGARRRKRLRQGAGNEHWLHLCAGRVSARETLQKVWSWTSLVCLVSTSLTIVAAVVERLADDIDDADDDDLSVVHEMLAALVTTSVCYTSLHSSLLGLDHVAS